MRGDKPDWLSLVPVTRSASSVIDGMAARIKLPAFSTLQVSSSANYWISKFASGGLVDIGRIIQRPTRGLSVARFIDGNGSTTDTAFSQILPTEGMIGCKCLVQSLNATSSQLVEFDATNTTYTENTLVNYLGPAVTLRNESTQDIELAFGASSAELSSGYGNIYVDTTIFFRMAPNSYLDSW